MGHKTHARGIMAVSMAIFGTLGIFVRHIPVSSGELALYRAVLAAALIGMYLLLRRQRIDLAAIKKGAAVPLMFYLSKDECKSIGDRVSITRICAAQADTFLAHSDLQSNASVYSSCTALLLNKH